MPGGCEGKWERILGVEGAGGCAGGPEEGLAEGAMYSHVSPCASVCVSTSVRVCGRAWESVLGACLGPY